jgi:hypothetical protein
MAVKPRRRAPRRPDKDTARQHESLKALQQTVETVATRLHRDKLLQPGTIVFRAAADDKGSMLDALAKALASRREVVVGHDDLDSSIYSVELR